MSRSRLRTVAILFLVVFEIIVRLTLQLVSFFLHGIVAFLCTIIVLELIIEGAGMGILLWVLTILVKVSSGAW